MSTPVSLQLLNNADENDWVANPTGNIEETLTFAIVQSLNFSVPTVLVKQQPDLCTAASDDFLARMDASDLCVSQSHSKKPAQRNYTWGYFKCN